MKLKSFIESLDEVEEAHRDFYTATEGGFVLDVESVNGLSLENVDGLKSALGKQTRAAKEAKDKLDAFGDITPEKAKSALSKVEEMDGWDKDEKVRQQIDQGVKAAQDKFDSEKQGLETRLQSTVAQLDQRMTSEAISAAAAKHAPGKPIRPFLSVTRDFLRVEEVDGERRLVVLDEEGEPKVEYRDGKAVPSTVDDLFGWMKEQDDFMGLYPSTGHSGAGSRSSGGGMAGGPNPWAKDTENATQQAAMINSDPQKAKAMAAKAGVVLPI